MGEVPTISRFLGLVITMYFDDHDPPHFHALHADGEAKVGIETLEVIESSLGRRHLRFVLAWAELHQDELAENWHRARVGETLDAIGATSMIGLTPKITALAVRRHGVLALTFADGLAGEVDVLARMRGPVFQRARTRDGFAEAALDEESGTVTWPGGADLAPDTLYQRVKTGTWPGRQIAAA